MKDAGSAISLIWENVWKVRELVAAEGLYMQHCEKTFANVQKS
jgi:hypothetical protein